MAKILRAIIAAVVAASLASGAYAGDYSVEVEREASKVFGEVMSPFCPGKLIADCPSPPAMQLRESIRERIAAGESAASIRSEIYDTYGEALRAAPTTDGFDLAAWVLPPAFVLLGAIALFVWIRRQRSDPGSATPPSTVLSPGDKATIESELEKMGERTHARKAGELGSDRP